MTKSRRSNSASQPVAVPVDLEVRRAADVSAADILAPLDDAALRLVLGRLTFDHGRPQAEATVSFVGDREMTRVNTDALGHAYTTDVLSWSYHDPHDPAAPAEGELLINPSYALREARLRGIDPPAEVLLYLIHGWLHVLGYDDQRAAEKAEMDRVQASYWSMLRAHLGV